MTLVITAPTEGAIVPPVHDIIGTGAEADAEVQLWSQNRDPETGTPNATTTADADGNWGFTGDTPASLGPVTWTVISGGESASVSITVSEDAPVPPEPDEGGGYMPPDPPTVYEDIAGATSDPSVADGQPPNPTMATTNAYEKGGLPMSPREPYPTGGAVPRSYAEINSGRR